MLVSEPDSKYSNAQQIALKGYVVQYLALTDEILIHDKAGKEPVPVDLNRPARQKRKCCRYVRNDIQVSIAEGRLLFRREYTKVRLIDVSQVGVSVGFEKKLKCGQLLRLVLAFQDGQSFEFRAVITSRRVGVEETIYGLKFEKPNRRFEEYLLKTGLKIKLNNVAMKE
jgi:PilZ domain